MPFCSRSAVVPIHELVSDHDCIALLHALILTGNLQVAETLCAYVKSQGDPNEPVVKLASPAALKSHFEQAGLPLELEDCQQAAASQQLLSGVSTALRYSVRTGHPGFFNQLYARADPVSIAADWLVVAANTNVHTYEVAPVFTAVEVEVLSKLARCIGGEYAQEHDGLFAPGGSISNIYGKSLALTGFVVGSLGWTHCNVNACSQATSQDVMSFASCILIAAARHVLVTSLTMMTACKKICSILHV